MTQTDKEKIEEIREILLGLKWFGSEYRYKMVWRNDGTPIRKKNEYDSDDWDRKYLDDMIDKLTDIVEQ